MVSWEDKGWLLGRRNNWSESNVLVGVNQVKKEVLVSVMSDPLRPHGLQPARLLCPRDSPGKTTGVGSHFFLQGIFLTQGADPGLLHGSQILYHLSHQGSPKKKEEKVIPGGRTYVKTDRSRVLKVQNAFQLGSGGKLQNLKLDLYFWEWGKVENRDNKGDCSVFYLSVPITLTEIRYMSVYICMYKASSKPFQSPTKCPHFIDHDHLKTKR